MNYWRIKKYDIANGPGLRASIWVTGCTFHCQDCFNEELWDFHHGKPFDKGAEAELFSYLSDPHCKGLSVLGGEPLMQGEEMVELLAKAKSLYPPKNVWLWTGFSLEHALQDDVRRRILDNCDFVVDGRFVHALHGPHLYFRGSSNQRIFRRTDRGDGTFVFEQIEDPETYFSR